MLYFSGMSRCTVCRSKKRRGVQQTCNFFSCFRVATPDCEAVEAVDWVGLLQEGEVQFQALGSESDLSDWSDGEEEEEAGQTKARNFWE